jgi:acyl-CoA reductase-like NAD-dependent aldehyde dehydrogenase
MNTDNPNQVLLDFSTFRNVIDGQLKDTAAHRSSNNPSTLEKNANSPISTINDVNNAVSAARKAFKLWARVPQEERKHAIMKFASALEANAQAFAAMVVKEQGKPVRSPPASL